MQSLLRPTCTHGQVGRPRAPWPNGGRRIQMAKLTQKQKEEVSRLTQADLRAIHTFHGGTIYVDGGRVAVPKPRAYGPVYGAAKEAAINWYVKSFLRRYLGAALRSFRLLPRPGQLAALMDGAGKRPAPR